MKIIKNEGSIDRGIRFLLAEILFIIGYFWVGGIPQIVLFGLALALLVTTYFGFCWLYTLLGIQTCPVGEKSTSKTVMAIFVFAILAIAVGGSYASDFFTKKFFLEDYNAMNQYFKQALFFTGQENREEAVVNYTKLTDAYRTFHSKYQEYHPYVLRNDKELNTDLDTIASLIETPREKVLSGDLKSAHLDLEQVRPVFQDILKRNGFSMLAVTLVDFHDAMEKIISAADAKNTELVIVVYTEVSEKLLAVEEEASDAEIQVIRQNLESLLTLAKQGTDDALPAKAAELKSSFVKVYLKRG